MELTIGEVSEKTGLSISKLRYYDEHGLIPNLKRSSSGLRKFSIENLEAITIIECLKTSGMQLKEIKELKDSTKENELASDNKKLKKENKELTEKLEEANKIIQELTEKISAKDSNEKEGK